eukprot:360398-Chlamydomonas_euryale.AAC.6
MTVASRRNSRSASSAAEFVPLSALATRSTNLCAGVGSTPHTPHCALAHHSRKAWHDAARRGTAVAWRSAEVARHGKAQ